MLPAFLAILTGCSQGSDSKLANLFVFNLSSDAYFDVYKDIAELGSFRSKLARFGSTKWTVENEGKRLSAINLNGRLLRFDLISPAKISNGRKAMEKSFRNKSGYWKSIGLDVNAKITPAQVKTGVDIMSKLVDNLTSSRPGNLNLSKEDQRAMQRLHIVMSTSEIIRTSAKGPALALEEDDGQPEQNPVDDQGQQPEPEAPVAREPTPEERGMCQWGRTTQQQMDECFAEMVQPSPPADCSDVSYTAAATCNGKSGPELDQCKKEREGAYNNLPEYSHCPR
jgi:hypothetical protein